MSETLLTFIYILCIIILEKEVLMCQPEGSGIQPTNFDIVGTQPQQQQDPLPAGEGERGFNLCPILYDPADPCKGCNRPNCTGCPYI